MDGNRLEELADGVRSGELGPISSLLIVRGGHLVFEEYFLGRHRDQLHPLYSVTKSVTSATVGIALAWGLITDLQAPLLGFFPEHETANGHPWKDAITLEHALQMRTGIQWDEFSANYSSPLNPVYHLYRSADWFGFVLDQPMETEPGTAFRYNTGVSVLLSGVIQRAVGASAEVFTRERLLYRIGIDGYSWHTGPGGVTDTGGGLSLRPRDMARFGFLILRGGIWEPTGEEVIPEDWLQVSKDRHTAFSSGGGYGYQWWVSAPMEELNLGPFPYASGWGGQRIYVVPALDMVVVQTGEGFRGEEIAHGMILRDYIFPAVVR